MNIRGTSSLCSSLVFRSSLVFSPSLVFRSSLVFRLSSSSSFAPRNPHSHPPLTLSPHVQLYHQFHDGFAPGENYPASYNNIKNVLNEKGLLDDTSCPYI